MDIDKIAADRINELESLVEDLYIILDLRDEDISDLKLQVRLRDKQIASLMNSQKVNYEFAG